MKLKFVALAALPLLLSGCAEVISFAAGFGAGYFTGQYMSQKEVEAARIASKARSGPVNRSSVRGAPAYGQSQMTNYATPYGHYAYGATQMNAQTQQQYQQYYQQQQQMQAQQMQQQPRPYGVPQAATATSEAPQTGEVKTETNSEQAAAEVKIIPATPQATYQPNTQATQAANPATAAPAPAAPQAMMQPPVTAQPPMMAPPPMQAQQGAGGYYIAPIPMAPLQGMPPSGY